MTAHFAHKKSLGQHFLNNARVPERMVESGEVTAGDVVVEVGPGTGALTEVLLARGARVIALEADSRALRTLSERFESALAEGRLTLIHGDVRTFDFSKEVPALEDGGYKVIANIPYYLSGMLFRLFLEARVQPSLIVFLVQKEVAERIARDAKESLLSLSVKVYGEPQYVLTVKRGNFTPQPKVDSAIIAVRHISRKNLENIDTTTFFRVLHAGFGSKRKQLLGNLTSLLPREKLLPIFSTLGIKPDVRGEDLSLDIWLSLTRSLLLNTKGTGGS